MHKHHVNGRKVLLWQYSRKEMKETWKTAEESLCWIPVTNYIVEYLKRSLKMLMKIFFFECQNGFGKGICCIDLSFFL